MNTKMMSGPNVRPARGNTVRLATILAYLLLALLVIGAILIWPAASDAPSAVQSLSGERFLAQNPELSAAQRYAAAPNAASGEQFLARNPELMVAARYAEALEALSGERFLAQNPELSVARRYVELQVAQ